MAGNKSFKDPITSSERQVLFGRDAKAISDSLIGFINRDEQITEKLSVPQRISSLGRDYFAAIKQELGTMTDVIVPTAWDSKDWGTKFATRVGAAEAVPGIMTLWFQPVIGDTDEEGASVTHQSYLSKWMAARNLDNMTKNWQPGDMQFVDASLGFIKMYLSVATRALLIMRDVAQKSENKYYNKVAMLKAMGFNFTEYEIVTHFDSMWSYFNRSIVSLINSNAWLKYSYPGVNRWAALCEALYRDTPAKTDYAQIYCFMPYYMVQFGEQYEDLKRIGWTMSWRNAPGTDTPQSWKERYAMDNVAAGDKGYQGFMQFLHDLFDLMKFLFYNDDVKDIIATLNAIATRGYGNELSDSERFSFQRLDFSPDNAEMRAPVIYDSAMLLAIHNATIMTGLKTDSVSILSKIGKLEQRIYFDLDDYSEGTADGAPWANKYAGVTQIYLPKVVNFPNFNPTQCDLINATQWTVSIHGAFEHGSPVLDPTSVPTDAVGTDFICAADIITMHVSSLGSGVYACDTDLSTYESYAVFPYTGIVYTLPAYGAAGNIINDWGMANDPVRYCMDSFNMFTLANQFAMAPIATQFVIAQNGTPKTAKNYFAYQGPVIQSEVYYIADGSDLGRFHSQWKSNFWGYPIYNSNGTGSVQLTVGPNGGDVFNANPTSANDNASLE